nr:MAG TPA: hypothetical protein [Caudoviricetes sp.]
MQIGKIFERYCVSVRVTLRFAKASHLCRISQRKQDSKQL